MADDELSRYAAKHQQTRKKKKAEKAARRKAVYRAAMNTGPQRSRRPLDLRGPGGRVALGVPSSGLVSVLMSAYRAKRWLAEAVASILSQKLPWGWRLELILGVDACHETLLAARGIGDPRLVIVEMTENVGTYETLNALLDHARGSLVAVMDSDDVSLPGRLSAGVQAMVQDPNLGIVAGAYRNCDEKMNPTGPATAKVCHGAMMARRSLYDHLGGYKPWRCGADWDFFARADKTKFSTRLQDATFLHRRVHPSSLCQSPDTRPKSPAREMAFAEIEKEKARPRPTLLGREPRSHVVVRDLRPSFSSGIGVVMPTVPSRAKTAAAVARMLLRQGIDVLHVHLNGHGTVPAWARQPRIRAFLHPEGTGPIVRFTDLPNTEYILSVDDDIAYPADYVRRTVDHLKRSGPRTALSYHAAWWAKDSVPGYADRSSLTYESGSPGVKRVPYGGSGVAAFHGGDLWHLDAEDAPSGYAMEDDVWISAALARTGCRLIRPPTAAKWITSTEAGATGLYTQATSDNFRARDSAIAGALAMGVWDLGCRTPKKAAATAPIDERKFWNARYGQTGTSILTVGRRDASVSRNELEYAQAIEQFKKMVTADFDDPRSISVLDVGYGLGHYARALAQLGVRDYTGIDFASPAGPPELVAKGYEFRQRVDASDPDLDLGRRFDLIVVIDVIFHIVGTARFTQAVDNLRKHAGGMLYVTGLFEDRRLAPHVRHRAPARFGPLGPPLSMDVWRDNKIARFKVESSD
jgi:hypothetical protein